MTDWPPKASVYTPFFRRFFTDEEARDIRETQALYADAISRNLIVDPCEVVAEVEAFLDLAPAALLPALLEAVGRTAALEAPIYDLPRVDLTKMNVKELVEFRDFLRRKLYFLENAPHILDLLKQCLVRIFCEIADHLPQAVAPSPFTIPLIYGLPRARILTEQLLSTVCENRYVDRGLFRDLRRVLYFNLCAANNVKPLTEHKKPLKGATKLALPLNETNDTFLSGTPFHELFNTPIPLKFTHEERFNHMHVLGGTGAGKTTLLQNLILYDLQSDNAPALIIVDSQGDLIRNVSRLALFHPEHGKLKDKLILISPKDIKHPPGLNVFDLNRSRLGDYDEVVREQVVAGAIQTFDYLFAGLLGADLTAKQGVFFKYVARLMLSLPDTMHRNATILDMLHLMEDPAPYRKAIESLPPIPRNFFEKDFANKTFAQTKEQIRYRLQAIIENPTIARLFTAEETKIDLFTEINRGSIILVDTAKDFLKGSSSHFGRIFISLVLQAVLERAALPSSDRSPAFLIVDEAAAYFDSNIDDLLTEARKYKLGCLFAHQYLDQAAASLRASLAANTSIKFAAGLSMGDARQMAPDMRTTPEFILEQPRLHFAAHIRNVTPSAVSIPVEVGKMEREPQLSPDDYEILLERNRVRVSRSRVVLSTKIAPPQVVTADTRHQDLTDESATNPSTDW